MRLRGILALFVCWVASLAFAKDEPGPLSALAPLVGHWTADSDPKMPGVTGGSTFEWEAQGHALVRKNRASYPATADKPASTHDDLLVFFSENGQLHADYFDNEGHVIRYGVTASTSNLVLVSDAGPGPRFRLTYSWAIKDKLDLAFEIAPPGKDQFKPYIQAHLHRE